MKKLFTLLFALFSLQAVAQSVSKQDYQRAVSFMWDNLNNKKVFNLHVVPNWFADSTGFWYTHYSPEGKIYYQVTFKPLQKSVLFNHEQVAEKLKSQLNTTFDSKNLDIAAITHLKPGQISFTAKGKKFIWNSNQNALSIDDTKEPPRNWLESKSPDGKWIAYTENYNLYLRSTENGAVKQLSTRGYKNYEYASYYGWSDMIEGENRERPKRFGVSWSPDSKWIQTSVCDLRHAQKMYLLDWSVDTLYRARLLSYYRGSPGDTTVVHLEPVAFNIETGKEFSLPLPRIAHENGYSFQWSDVATGVGYASYRERGFQKGHLIKVDLNTNQHTTLFTDSSITNIDGFDYWLYEKAGWAFVSSERSGWKQVYSINLKTFELKPVTQGNYFVTDIHHFDSKTSTLYFSALGREAGNPYQPYFYSISLSGKNLKLLTPEPATHTLAFSPNNNFVVDNYSTPVNPTVTVLRDVKTGKVLLELAKADVTGLQAMGYTAPEPFTAVGKDGATPIYGLLWKPSNFDATKKYSVIDHSYTGPHGNIVPTTYVRAININNQALAELGFIVMMVDGLGTANRSKAFHDYSYKKMGYNLQDHVNALQQLATTKPWLDITRVGIFGHSVGGYDAGHALLQYPDFYKVGVASSADHDFRMEKAWWPEMYMGWPVDTAYHNQSSITMAKNLKGKLLITHGGIDENVNPSATFKLAEMLQRADKQFDLMIFPSQRHGYVGDHQRYFTKLRWNYFVKHLRGAEPVWEFAWK